MNEFGPFVQCSAGGWSENLGVHVVKRSFEKKSFDFTPGKMFTPFSFHFPLALLCMARESKRSGENSDSFTLTPTVPYGTYVYCQETGIISKKVQNF